MYAILKKTLDQQQKTHLNIAITPAGTVTEQTLVYEKKI